MTNPSRRTALKTMGAACATASLPTGFIVELENFAGPIRFGVIADLHGGLAIDAEARLDSFLEAMKDEPVAALIQMGDFAFPNEKHQAFADKFNAAHANTIHVIGNHEFDFGLTRENCFKAWGIKAAYYARDIKGLRLLVLDGNEKGPDYISGYPSYIGKQQQAWLAEELNAADRPVLILCHQPLAGESSIDNATEIQELLASHKDKIALCLNGHSHVDSLLQVEGVNYLHINSASYYWVGGEKRMAYYEDPLFTMITIDPAKSTIEIQAKFSRWKEGDAPASIGYFDRNSAPPETIVIPAIRGRNISGNDVANRTIDTWPAGIATDLNDQQPVSSKDEPSHTTLKVMTWNIWGRLNQDPRYTVNEKTARERTIEIIRESGADFIAMIETYGSAADIAAALKFHHYTPAADANLCIFSRYPLSNIQPLTGLSPFSFIAATATLPSDQKIRIYDIWLTSSGRHIVEIKNKELSDQDFCAGDDVRFEMLQKFLNHDDFKRHVSNSANVPVIVAGDFNCVSHLDHTQATRHSKLNHSRVLPIKVSKAMLKAGFADTYRDSNPDILDSTLGHTWTTVGMGYVYKTGEGFVPIEENPEPQYRDPYTRIDYIYSIGSKLQSRTSKTITHHRSESQRSFPEFPSDHAAVVTEFVVKK